MRWSDLVLPGWILGVSVLLLGPVLGPGYTLSYDMVFAAHQDLLPSSIGIGGGLPRAVPQDAVVAVLSTITGGALLQHVILLAIPVLAGGGVARLLRGTGRGVQLMAASLAIWNPFVIERLVQGHWALLLAYAATPWAIDSARRLRCRGFGAAGVVGWCALGALVPSGGLTVALVAVPMAIIGGLASTMRKVLLVGSVIAVNLPWIVPALLHESWGTSDNTGADVFALRAEGPWGAALTALGGGGLWNADAVPASRGTWLALVLTLAVFALGVVGWSSLLRLIGSAVAGWWTAVALIGWVLAVLSALTPTLWVSAISTIPGAGLARDSHKLLAPLVLLLAVSAALGGQRLWRLVSDATARRSLMVAGILLPIAFLPDGAWGVSGRLAAVDYPTSWYQMRDFFRAQTQAGDVIVLPWSTFRRYAFNEGRTVLDPTPRWLPRSSIAADDLPVRQNEAIVLVAGDDPRSATVGGALQQGRAMADVMPELGARWVLVDVSQGPQIDPSTLAGLNQVFVATPFAVWELPPDIPLAQDGATPGSRVVIAIDIAVVLGLLALAGHAALRVAGVRNPGRGQRRGSAPSTK